MREKPILFSAPMVRAILAGTKTQTRRVCKGQRELSNAHDFQLDRCPYGEPGDRLWVRETFQRFTDDGEIIYKADPAGFEAMNELKRDQCLEARWRPSIHMPRWASRITLEVTGVRVERLQDISADDARAEGCPDKPVAGAEQASVDLLAKLWFHDLWAQINGQAFWDANPWVWVVEFRRIAP